MSTSSPEHNNNRVFIPYIELFTFIEEVGPLSWSPPSCTTFLRQPRKDQPNTGYTDRQTNFSQPPRGRGGASYCCYFSYFYYHYYKCKYYRCRASPQSNNLCNFFFIYRKDLVFLRGDNFVTFIFLQQALPDSLEGFQTFSLSIFVSSIGQNTAVCPSMLEIKHPLQNALRVSYNSNGETTDQLLVS